MTTEKTRRAVAKFLAADRPDLDKLHFLRRLAALARDVGKGGPVARDEREAALLMVVHQSPNRSWNRSRLSEARLVFDCYSDFDTIVHRLQQSGNPFTWHDVIAALRQWRKGAPIDAVKRRDTRTLRAALSRFARSRDMSVLDVDQQKGRLTVTFALKGQRK